MVRHHVIAALALLTIARDVNPAAPAPLLPDSRMGHVLQAGDLVLREGRGWRAGVVRAAFRFRFTHVGIVTERRGDGVWMVAHAAPPDGDDPGGVRIEPLTRFAAADQASDLAFERARDLDLAGRDRLVKAVEDLAAEGHPFDDGFDLADPHALYCTELVWLAFSKAGHPFSARTTYIILGPIRGDYMLPQDLILAGRFLPVHPSGNDQ